MATCTEEIRAVLAEEAGRSRPVALGSWPTRSWLRG